jgi:hypothetical protein
VARKPEGKRLLGRPRCRWKDNFRICLTKSGESGTHCIHHVGKFLNSGVSRMTQFQELVSLLVIYLGIIYSEISLAFFLFFPNLKFVNTIKMLLLCILILLLI